MSTLKTTNVQHPSAADPAIELDAAGKLWLAGGKILQIVRATDVTDRTTTSATSVDASISVTITPQRSTSAVLVIWTARIGPGENGHIILSITDSTDAVLSGAQASIFGSSNGTVQRDTANIIGYASPGSTSAVTYKGRFSAVTAGTSSILNASQTGQLYAIEVSA